MTVWSIGHSTRSLTGFVDLLNACGVEQVADIRTVPKSRRHPHFHTDALALSLSRAGIAYVTPRTRITFGPAAKTRSRNPVFRFTDSTGQPGTGFQCKLDRRRWRSCRSPLRLKRLGRGRHLLRVVAINAAGAADASPVRRAFKVVPR